MLLTVTHEFLPKVPTVRTGQIMDLFGIDFQQGRHVIAEQLPLPIQPGQVVLFSGASGSGKSSLLRAAARELGQKSRIVNVDDVVLAERSLIDLISLPLEEAVGLLTACGLGEAQLLLRSPSELSEGQRYRFRLALALSQQPDWLVADEFTATLDRTLAKVVAYNIRRLCDRTDTGFLLATTHNDIIDDLQPDIFVRCHLDGTVTATDCGSPLAQAGKHDSENRVTFTDRKKKVSPSPTNSGSPPRPDATGRTSLGGITAATTSE